VFVSSNADDPCLQNDMLHENCIGSDASMKFSSLQNIRTKALGRNSGKSWFIYFIRLRKGKGLCVQIAGERALFSRTKVIVSQTKIVHE
jgi:hypothetical protein